MHLGGIGVLERILKWVVALGAQGPSMVPPVCGHYHTSETGRRGHVRVQLPTGSEYRSHA
jgi:hypothetical protein